MGIDSANLMTAGQLLGEKTVLNEFIAYFSMNKLQASGALTDDRTRTILTYALCGFSNIVSIGIQIGGIGAIAPEKRPELARLGWRALLGGSLACFLTASVESASFKTRIRQRTVGAALRRDYSPFTPSPPAACADPSENTSAQTPAASPPSPRRYTRRSFSSRSPAARKAR